MNQKHVKVRKAWRTALALSFIAAFAGASACGKAQKLTPLPDTTPVYDAGSTTPMPTTTATTPVPTTTTTTTATSPIPTTMPDGGTTAPGSDASTYTFGAGDTVQACPGTTPIDPVALNFPTCPLCDDAYCVPTATLSGVLGAADGGSSTMDLLADCADGMSKCVPSSYVATLGKFLLKTCHAFDGAAEGRCVNKCIPRVANQAGLTQDVCGANELCAPCFMPTDGSDTGACNLGCDTGPTENTYLFDKCCGDTGSCVPTSMVPTNYQSMLGTDTCTGTDVLCAPDVLADPTYIPPTCTSVAGAEGRCLAACIPQIAAQASLLPQATCAAGELCAPCFDPILGQSTGACEINGDAPANTTPTLFPECCGGEGSCIPVDLLTDAQKTQLGADTCTNGDLCAPKVFAAPGAQATPCDSIDGAEGRCLPTCVPMVEQQASRLPQSTCPSGDLCAPCYDPITGADTSACTQNGDSPTRPKYTFPLCCGGLGVCVPTNLVPTAQQSMLGVDTCTGTDVLCAPTSLTDPTVKPDTCYSFEPQHREGRCLPACIPQVQTLAAQLQQETCASGELCAPCYDPRTGDPTGACDINGDAPVDPNPGPFVTCPAVNAFCVLLPICTPCDGRCVPSYIVPSDQASLLVQGQCQTGELCAPCYNPLDGTSTGACGPDGQTCP